MQRHLPPPTRFANAVGQAKRAGEARGLPVPPPVRFGPGGTAQAKLASGVRLAAGAPPPPLKPARVIQPMNVKLKPIVHGGNWGNKVDVNADNFSTAVGQQIVFLKKAVDQWFNVNKKRPKIASKWTSAFKELVSAVEKDAASNDTKNAYKKLCSLGLKPSEEPPKGTDEALEVWDDMKDQYTRWDQTLTNRGAWWGSANPGSTVGAQSVSDDAVKVLKTLVTSAWKFSDSWSGGLSFHRKTTDLPDFIYHMKAP